MSPSDRLDRDCRNALAEAAVVGSARPPDGVGAAVRVTEMSR
jgi:hypothetical protein